LRTTCLKQTKPPAHCSTIHQRLFGQEGHSASAIPAEILVDPAVTTKPNWSPAYRRRGYFCADDKPPAQFIDCQWSCVGKPLHYFLLPELHSFRRQTPVQRPRWSTCGSPCPRYKWPTCHRCMATQFDGAHSHVHFFSHLALPTASGCTASSRTALPTALVAKAFICSSQCPRPLTVQQLRCPTKPQPRLPTEQRMACHSYNNPTHGWSTTSARLLSGKGCSPQERMVL